MLKLINIVKEYPVGDSAVLALKGVDLEFRRNEFVSVLGHSGCGKTTLLNIIGGLDQYTTGDLIIEGRSTKDFKDHDWDAYRNHSVGFVFQSYNLIPHQTVLANVELALTLSGVSKSERKEKAAKALERVGLGDQLNKKPNQLSGGQMQRVAIARALVNDPEILLADEPTGALDTDTSVQVMELLKEISQEKLVIMVTHNPELADEYSTRIIRLVDGKVVDDSNPYKSEESSDSPASLNKKEEKAKKKAAKTRSMSFLTALSLSTNNLLTKKMRTFLTSFAGSIGIIGIALILSLSNGFQLYINSIQQEALTSYPMMIESATMDMNAMLTGMTAVSPTGGAVDHGLDKVYSNTMATEMMKSMAGGVKNNDLKSLKEFLEGDGKAIKEEYSTTVQYNYGGKLNIYSSDVSNGTNQVYPGPVVDIMGNLMGGMSSGFGGLSMDASMMGSMETMMNSWQQLIDNDALLEEQYDVISGRMPEKYNEVVLIVDKNNEISELAIQGLGLMDESSVMDAAMAVLTGQDYSAPEYEITYEEVLSKTFRIVLEPDYFAYNEETKTWEDKREDEEYVKKLVQNGEEIKIVGIIRPADGSLMVTTTGAIGYTAELNTHIIEKTNECKIVKQQKANPEIDVFTGLPFVAEEKAEVEQPTQATPEMSGVSLDPQINTGYKAIPDTAKNMLFSGNAPVASNIAIKFDVNSMMNFQDIDPMTEEEIYAAISAGLSGDEAAQMKRLVDLMLKEELTAEEKSEFKSAIKPMLEGTGIGADMAVSFLSNMSREDKLKVLTGIIQQNTPDTPDNPVTNPDEPVTDNPVTNPDEPVTDKPVTDTPTDTPETDLPVEQVPVVPEIEEPEPFAESYEEALEILGVADLETPKSIYIYPKDFESKDAISAMINEYNEKNADNGKSIVYTDYIGLLLSSVTKIVDVISYVLIAFVAISLVVSSIMIGIITYISVLERTKEIGILRAIGASKRDISRVFNAETLIVGFVSGFLGIAITLLLTIPINIVIEHLTSIAGVAQLPPAGGIILVIISMSLTLIAGLIPARIASKKDPVVALRTE